jgi:hypothetical protein
MYTPPHYLKPEFEEEINFDMASAHFFLGGGAENALLQKHVYSSVIQKKHRGQKGSILSA